MNNKIKISKFFTEYFTTMKSPGSLFRVEKLTERRFSDCLGLYENFGILEGDPLSYYLYLKDKNNINFFREEYKINYTSSFKEELGFNILDINSNKVVCNVLNSDAFYDEDPSECLKEYKEAYEIIKLYADCFQKFPEISSANQKRQIVMGLNVVTDLNYRRLGLFEFLNSYQLKIFKDYGYSKFFTLAHSSASMNFFVKNNYQILDELDYRKVRDSNGNLRFPDFEKIIYQRKSSFKNFTFYLVCKNI